MFNHSSLGWRRRRRLSVCPAAKRAALLLTCTACTPLAVAQYSFGTALFNFSFNESVQEQLEYLKNLPVLEDIFFPEKYGEPRDYYEWSPSDPANGYTQNVLFDPCRFHGVNCCNDTYGVKEFQRIDTTRVGSTLVETRYEVREDGTLLSHDVSRSVERDTYINELCTGVQTPFKDCVDVRLAKRESSLHPPCFNYNETMVADKQCRSPSDNSPLDLCVEIGIMQTAHILECGGAYEADPHCGTWVEVHRRGFAEVLSATRIKSVFTSGYRTTVLSTTYKRASDRVLCFDPLKLGNYEVWWVQRTLDRWRVERRIPFRIVSPLCDWDAVNNRYQPYATVGQADTLVGFDLFDESRFLFARERKEGTVDGRPGKGMGALVVPRLASSYPAGAAFIFGDDRTYRYTPPQPEYTVKRGVIEPPNVQPDTI